MARDRWKSVAIASVVGGAVLLWMRAAKRKRTRLVGLYHEYHSVEEGIRLDKSVPCNVSAAIRADLVEEFLAYARASNDTLRLLGRPQIHVFWRVVSTNYLQSNHKVDGWFVSSWVEPSLLVTHEGGDAGGVHLQEVVGRAFGDVSAKCHPKDRRRTTRRWRRRAA